jgi:hypothetical protein
MRAAELVRRRCLGPRRYRPHFVGPFARTMNPGERNNPACIFDFRESQSVCGRPERYENEAPGERGVPAPRGGRVRKNVFNSLLAIEGVRGREGP